MNWKEKRGGRMTAKEMFEELGYSQTSLGHVIIFEKKLNYSVKKIMFAPKTVAVFDENMNPLWLDATELRACNELFEELGWNNDKRGSD